ncbi:DMT family transporter [Bacillus sp. es.036]|uniref:DMT family transporter n=1 Tax=Bacillus sp. es.036 TaxID=1761764 RepID=UPI000BF94509|nr:DMT family transporter [Bacillus sp. es.036]PFG12314.1 putative membrane protein [Bacillus sp. es.036]
MKNGVILAIVSSVIFSLMNALVKSISDTVPTSEIVFFRSFIGTVLIYFFMKSSNVPFSRKGIPFLMLRGIFGALYLLAYFYTISKIPLADASILAHLSPFFAVFFSYLFLKERVSKQVMYILPLVLVGVVLLAKPGAYSSYSLFALVGVASALFAGAAAVSIRFLSKAHHSFEIVFYFLATGTLITIPLMWNNFVLPSPTELSILVGIGVVSLLGQVFLTKAFTHESVVVVEIARYIGIVFNILWGFLFWAEVPDLLTVTGGILIVTSCILLSRKKHPVQKSKISFVPVWKK